MRTMQKQTIDVPLKVGSWVTVFGDIDTDEDSETIAGFAGDVVFEDKVVQYVPQTNKLVFAESDIGYADFCDILDDHKSTQIIHPDE